MSDTAGLSPGRNGCAPSFTCCSVRIDAHTLESAVDALLSRPDQHEGWAVHLCNAYTLSLARRDPELRHRLNQGNLNLPDGMPLIWVGRRLGLDHLEGQRLRARPDARRHGPRPRTRSAPLPVRLH